MAGCISIRRKEEFTPTSRLQRLSATLIVFSEASENPAAWVFLLLFKIQDSGFGVCDLVFNVENITLSNNKRRIFKV
jgi:hypothetical protein